jgi:hypothetical protein
LLRRTGKGAPKQGNSQQRNTHGGSLSEVCRVAAC